MGTFGHQNPSSGALSELTKLGPIPGATSLAARIRHDVTGAACTTFAIGGAFEAFVEVEDLSELRCLLACLYSRALPYRIIGAGSNLLVSSQGLSGITIRLGRGFRTIDAAGAAVLRVGGACSLMSLTREVCEQGLSGIEFAGGIPASLGGAVVMNAGAHGGEMAQVVESVVVALPDGSIQEIAAPALSFSYRHSVLPQGAVVVTATLRLVEGDKDKIAARRREFLAERKARQPLKAPSAGSVFRNPSPLTPAGMLIEKAGMKGAAVGGARISDLHANWIVNEARSASDADVLELIELCQARVKSHGGVELVPELVRWR